MIRVVLPYHLRMLAGVGKEVNVMVDGPVTPRAIVDALEAEFPTLRGTIRDYATSQRRPMLRYFAVGEDFSHEPEDSPLPEAVATGQEPFRIVGAIAGG
jgi:molybdopterin synthase sulfur carrier subunit